MGAARRWTATLILVFQPTFAAAQLLHRGAIEGTVTTQQSTPLSAADIKIVDAAGRIVASASSENDGRFRVANLAAGMYRVVAALDGFTTTTQDVAVTPESPTVVVLDMPIASFSDTVDVVGAPAALANGQTLAPTAAVASRELDQFVPGQGLPGAVRLLPNVLPVAGGVSIKGGRPAQAGLQLAAMTLVDPASGVSRVTLPDDAIESVTVLPNPYAVEYGRFSSGLVVIQSRRARDRWKFRANRFGPSIRSRNDGGLRFESFNPRLEVGGPLVADRVFLEQTAQARFQVGDLASRSESEQRVTKAFSSFTRLDTNVSRRHLLVATVGMFPSVVEWATIGTFVPPEASVNFRMNARQISLTDRALWSDRLIGETTFQWYDSRTDVEPQGDLPMELQPDTALGNFFNRQHRTTSSYQIVHVLTAHRQGLGGSHLLKAGVDVMHTQYDGTSQSHAVLIERADATVVRRLDFSGPASIQAVGETEAAVFAQDRVQVHPRWYVEAGVRVDRDGVLRRVNLSPRIGTAVMLTESGAAVLRGGWGVFVERTPSMAGAFTTFESLIDTRFVGDAASSVRVTNTVAPVLETPASSTWDAMLDYRLNPRWAFRVGTMKREGRHELIVAPTVTDSGIERRLSSDGRSSYRDVEFAAQYTRGTVLDVEATYTRSHSEGDLNVLTNYYDVVLAPVVPDNVYTRLSTDVPHRLLVRGRVMPAPKWLLLGVFDWRTGLPYSVVNETLDFVGPRNELRFPNYCRLELGVERRLKILKFQPWVGVRFTNVLGRFLPEDIQNNTGSPSFGTFYNAEPRRLRLQVRFER